MSVVKIAKLSSAYAEIFASKFDPGSFSPLISSKFLILFANGSKHITYKSGDNEQPCRTPRFKENGSDIKLLTITEDEISV